VGTSPEVRVPLENETMMGCSSPCGSRMNSLPFRRMSAEEEAMRFANAYGA
jgi:hypothetical protein